MDDLFGLGEALSPWLAFVYIACVCIKASLGPCCFVWVMAVCQWEGTPRRAPLLHPFVYSSKGHICFFFLQCIFSPVLLLIFVQSLSQQKLEDSKNSTEGLYQLWTSNLVLFEHCFFLYFCAFFFQSQKQRNSNPCSERLVCDFHVLTCVHPAFVLPQMSHSRLHSFSVLTQSH